MSEYTFSSITKVHELDVLQVRHPKFEADIALQGAQLLTFKPTSDNHWIWLSPEAEYQNGQSLRGGIPICWPWFGVANKNPDTVANQITPSADTAASHGFARSMIWSLESITETCHDVVIKMALTQCEETLKVWPFEFKLTATFSLGSALCMTLTTENLSSKVMYISQALHTYFPCSDISNVSVSGTHGAQYTDALDGWETKTHIGMQRFSEEVDRIFHTGGPFNLNTGLGQLSLTSNNSASAIVWNPWVEKSKRLGQFGNERYKEMFCVETANVLEDVKTIEAGESFTLDLTVEKV